MNLIFRKTWTEDDHGSPIHRMAAYIRSGRKMTHKDRDDLLQLAGAHAATYSGAGQWFTEAPSVKIRGKRAIVRQMMAQDI